MPGFTMNDADENDKLYIGFDFSTEQAKAVVIDENLEVIAQEHVNFDIDLPEYRTHGGVHESGSRVTSPTIMWVKALDMLLDKLRVAGVDLYTIDGISGVGHHGSVYWRRGIKQVFANLQPDNFLYDQLATSFSLLDSPIWKDSSTQDKCGMLEEAVGGPENLAEITGSRATERFTGSQIAKFRKERPDAYLNTERISLVSSFAASLFLGDVAPIDWSDAGAMNILDVKSKSWSPTLLDAIGPDLSEKVGDPVFSATIVGCVSEYMQDRYGFKDNCRIVAFTGDNPGILAGLALGQNDVGFSLGTSDDLFFWLEDPKPQVSGHVWPNPVDETAYMGQFSNANGTLTRERIRNDKAEGSWDLFNELLDATPRGNFGNIGMYFDEEERGVKGDYRFNKSGARVDRYASAEAEVRALIEGQIMAKRVQVEKMGFKLNQDTNIVVTGPESVNKHILQVISDVFNSPVYVKTEASSAGLAALGAAYRAVHVCNNQGNHKSYLETVSSARASAQLTCSPNKDASTVYSRLIDKYKQLEQTVLSQI